MGGDGICAWGVGMCGLEVGMVWGFYFKVLVGNLGLLGENKEIKYESRIF